MLTINQARKMARSLGRKGLSHVEIGKKLLEAGYASPKTGGAMTQSGVSRLRKSKKPYAARRVVRTVVAHSPQNAMLRKILALKAEAETKLQMIELLLQA